MYKYFKNLSRHRWVTAECMPNLEKSANRSNLDGQSVRSTMRSHLIPYKRIYYYLYIIGIYGNEDPNNEIAWINTSNNITLPKRNTVWDVRVYNQTLIRVFCQPPKRQTAASTFELSRVLPPSNGGRAVVLYPSTGSAVKPTLIPECKEVPLALGPGMIRAEGLSPAFPSKVSHARCDH